MKKAHVGANGATPCLKRVREEVADRGNLTILGAQVLDESGALLASFSSHCAAFQAVCRLRDPTWRALFGDCLTPEDYAELERLRVATRPAS